MDAERLAPLLVIVGETASGKSALGLELAKLLNGEIICADSWTVYKDFDIGTAKPSQEERLEVPHHLLDVTTADEGFSAPQYKRLALAAIDDISRRGKLPIMVGGTGLYIDSVIYDYSFLPPSDRDTRARLNGLSLDNLINIAKERELPLSSVDNRNKRRVIRLIENDGRMPAKSSLRPNTLIIGLRLDREELAARIEARVDKMLAGGLEQEAKLLVKHYGWDCEPMKGVGYKEWQDYFEGEQGLTETRQKIIKASLDLAKKQRTWFKRNKSIQWINNRGNIDTVVDLITTKLNN